VGEGIGLGDGEGVGDGVRVGFGLSDGEGEGGGVGAPVVYPSNEGAGNSWTAMPSVAFNMKSCQMRAGIVPPYTAEYPSTFSRGISPFGYPTHTHVASRGT
jgi:hypothetical protein